MHIYYMEIQSVYLYVNEQFFFFFFPLLSVCAWKIPMIALLRIIIQRRRTETKQTNTPLPRILKNKGKKKKKKRGFFNMRTSKTENPHMRISISKNPTGACPFSLTLLPLESANSRNHSIPSRNNSANLRHRTRYNIKSIPLPNICSTFAS